MMNANGMLPTPASDSPLGKISQSGWASAAASSNSTSMSSLMGGELRAASVAVGFFMVPDAPFTAKDASPSRSKGRTGNGYPSNRLGVALSRTEKAANSQSLLLGNSSCRG
jgi:hypothetical protein